VCGALDSLAREEGMFEDTKTGYTDALLERKTLTTLIFSWGAMIICLPGKRVRGFSPNMIMIDEAAFMDEGSWQEILPMLKVKREKTRTIFLLSSTPFGTINRFYNIWMEEANNGEHGFPFHVTYLDCPFSDKEKVEKDLREGLLTENEYKREYLAEFIPSEGAAIPENLINKAIEDYEVLSDEELGLI